MDFAWSMTNKGMGVVQNAQMEWTMILDWLKLVMILDLTQKQNKNVNLHVKVSIFESFYA